MNTDREIKRFRRPVSNIAVKENLINVRGPRWRTLLYASHETERQNQNCKNTLLRHYLL